MTAARAQDRPYSEKLSWAERAVVWILCQLLPHGFRARQHAEWTGDLIVLRTSGAGGRWRYLVAAAWTLPSLRAHAGRPGVDRPHPAVPTSVPVKTLVRVILIGLGLPVLSWLIAVPLRWYLLDVETILTPVNGIIVGPFDPKDLWPTDGPFIVLIPLWIALSLGAWAIIMGWMLLAWVGLTAAVLGPVQRGAGRKHRIIVGLLGVALVTFAIVAGDPGNQQDWFPSTYFRMDKGLTAAFLGAIAIVIGVGTRGLTRRARIAVLAVGLCAIAIFAWHYTPTGIAMLNWHLD